MTGRREVLSGLAGLLAWLCAPVAVLAQDTPGQIIEAFHRHLTQVLVDADKLGFEGRRRSLLDVIDRTFNSAAIARIVVGAAWNKIDDATRQRLAIAVRDMSIATYASRFDHYGGETFVTTGERDGPRATRLIDTQVVAPGGDPVNLTYVAKQLGGRWWIIDVIVDNGISELALKRSEYRGALESGGVEGLIRALEDRTRSLANG